MKRRALLKGAAAVALGAVPKWIRTACQSGSPASFSPAGSGISSMCVTR